jgi:hypothetical protein
LSNARLVGQVEENIQFFFGAKMPKWSLLLGQNAYLLQISQQNPVI